MLIFEVWNMKNLNLTKISSVRHTTTEIIMTTGTGIFISITVSHIVCVYMWIYTLKETHTYTL